MEQPPPFRRRLGRLADDVLTLIILIWLAALSLWLWIR